MSVPGTVSHSESTDACASPPRAPSPPPPPPPTLPEADGTRSSDADDDAVAKRFFAKWTRLLSLGRTIDSVIQGARVVDKPPPGVLEAWEAHTRAALGKTDAGASSSASAAYFASREIAAAGAQAPIPTPVVERKRPSMHQGPRQGMSQVVPLPSSAFDPVGRAPAPRAAAPPPATIRGVAELPEALRVMGLAREADLATQILERRFDEAVALARDTDVLPLGWARSGVVFLHVRSPTSLVLVNGGCARNMHRSGLEYHETRHDADSRTLSVASAVELTVESTAVVRSEAWLRFAFHCFASDSNKFSAQTFYEALLPTALGGVAMQEVASLVRVWSVPVYEDNSVSLAPLQSALGGHATASIEPPPATVAPPSAPPLRLAQLRPGTGTWPAPPLAPADEACGSAALLGSVQAMAFGDMIGAAELVAHLDAIRSAAGLEAAAEQPSEPVDARALEAAHASFAAIIDWTFAQSLVPVPGVAPETALDMLVHLAVLLWSLPPSREAVSCAIVAAGVLFATVVAEQAAAARVCSAGLNGVSFADTTAVLPLTSEAHARARAAVCAFFAAHGDGQRFDARAMLGPMLGHDANTRATCCESLAEAVAAYIGNADACRDAALLFQVLLVPENRATPTANQWHALASGRPEWKIVPNKRADQPEVLVAIKLANGLLNDDASLCSRSFRSVRLTFGQTEEDVLYRVQLPTADGMLGSDEAEALFVLLTARHVRLHLLVAWLQQGEREAVILHPLVAELLYHAVAEPGSWIAADAVVPMPLIGDADAAASPLGLVFEPDAPLEPLRRIVVTALEHAQRTTGSAHDRSSGPLRAAAFLVRTAQLIGAPVDETRAVPTSWLRAATAADDYGDAVAAAILANDVPAARKWLVPAVAEHNHRQAGQVPSLRQAVDFDLWQLARSASFDGPLSQRGQLPRSLARARLVAAVLAAADATGVAAVRTDDGAWLVGDLLIRSDTHIVSLETGERAVEPDALDTTLPPVLRPPGGFWWIKRGHARSHDNALRVELDEALATCRVVRSDGAELLHPPAETPLDRLGCTALWWSDGSVHIPEIDLHLHSGLVTDAGHALVTDRLLAGQVLPQTTLAHFSESVLVTDATYQWRLIVPARAIGAHFVLPLAPGGELDLSHGVDAAAALWALWVAPTALVRDYVNVFDPHEAVSSPAAERVLACIKADVKATRGQATPLALVSARLELFEALFLQREDLVLPAGAWDPWDDIAAYVLYGAPRLPRTSEASLLAWAHAASRSGQWKQTRNLAYAGGPTASVLDAVIDNLHFGTSEPLVAAHAGGGWRSLVAGSREWLASKIEAQDADPETAAAASWKAVVSFDRPPVADLASLVDRLLASQSIDDAWALVYDCLRGAVSATVDAGEAALCGGMAAMHAYMLVQSAQGSVFFPESSIRLLVAAASVSSASCLPVPPAPALMVLDVKGLAMRGTAANLWYDGLLRTLLDNLSPFVRHDAHVPVVPAVQTRTPVALPCARPLCSYNVVLFPADFESEEELDDLVHCRVLPASDSEGISEAAPATSSAVPARLSDVFALESAPIGNSMDGRSTLARLREDVVRFQASAVPRLADAAVERNDAVLRNALETRLAHDRASIAAIDESERSVAASRALASGHGTPRALRYVLLATRVRLVCAALAALDENSEASRERLVALLAHRRVFVERHLGRGWAVDGLLAAFEYASGLALRRGQVEKQREMLAGGASCVHQMLMGEGKTTVIGPLLCLQLAGPVVVTTPPPLIAMTLGVLRAALGGPVFARRVASYTFARNDVARAPAAAAQMQRHAAAGTIVLASPTAIKATLLQYALGEDEAVARLLRLWRSGSLIMDEVDVILHPMTSELNFPLGDAVAVPHLDMRTRIFLELLSAIVHPSPELEALLAQGMAEDALQTSPHLVIADRDWYRPHLAPHLATRVLVPFVRAFLADRLSNLQQIDADRLRIRADSTRPPAANGSGSWEPENALALGTDTFWCSDTFPGSAQLTIAVADAGLPLAAIRLAWRRRSSFFGSSGLSMLPEVVDVLDGRGNVLVTAVEFCERTLWFDRPVTTDTILVRVRGKAKWFALQEVELFATAAAANSTSVSDARLVEALTRDGQQLASGELPPRGHDVVRLAADVLCSHLPHVLGRIDRVHFGLLHPGDGVYEGAGWKRRLVAVPFRGKDAPSAAAEFGHVDAAVGFTALAYLYEGLRASDVVMVCDELKRLLRKDTGPLRRRAAFLAFESFTNGNCLPLHQIDVRRADQLAACVAAMARNVDAIVWFLRTLVFPRVLTERRTKVSASGEDLGGAALFARRIGFSGTPSSLLPRDLAPCRYQPGSEGRILCTLSDPRVVSEQAVDRAWSVDALLCTVAQSTSLALIDCGALITGYTNDVVARKLLDAASAERIDGVVFLLDDNAVVLERASGATVPLAASTVVPARRLTFFDNTHTTGTDIVQANDACAHMTVGKDTKLRDYAQAAWRMRKLGQGQRLVTLIIPEVRRLVRRIGNGSLLAWLTAQGIAAEVLARTRLLRAQVVAVARTFALAQLLEPGAPHFERPPVRERMRALYFGELADVDVDEFVVTPAQAAEVARLKEENAAAQAACGDEAPAASTAPRLRWWSCFFPLHDAHVAPAQVSLDAAELDVEVTNEKEVEVELQVEVADEEDEQSVAWSGRPRVTARWAWDERASIAVPLASFVPDDASAAGTLLSPNVVPSDDDASRIKRIDAVAVEDGAPRALALSVAEADTLAFAVRCGHVRGVALRFGARGRAIDFFNCAVLPEDRAHWKAIDGAVSAFVSLRRRRRIDVGNEAL